MRRIDATRWCLKTLAKPSDRPDLISDHVALTFRVIPAAESTPSHFRKSSLKRKLLPGREGENQTNQASNSVLSG